MKTKKDNDRSAPTVWMKAFVQAVAERTAAEVSRRLNGHKAKPGAPTQADTKSEEMAAIIKCYDSLHDALRIIQCRSGVSKRQKRRRQPELRALLVAERVLLRHLEALGVCPMQLTDKVDYRLHEVLDTEPTCGAGEDGRVFEVCRRGFVCAERVLRMQQVVVLKYQPSRQTMKGE